jgi:hypothetical protein
MVNETLELGIESGVRVERKAFFATSPIDRSSTVKETHKGVIWVTLIVRGDSTRPPCCTLRRMVSRKV